MSNKSTNNFGVFFGLLIVQGALVAAVIIASQVIFDASINLSATIGAGVLLITAVASTFIIAAINRENSATIANIIRTIVKQPELTATTLKQSRVNPEVRAQIEELYAKQHYAITQASTQTQVVVEERNKIRSVLNAIKEGVIALDSQQNVIFYNQAASVITGKTLEEVAGQSVHDVLPITKDNKLILDGWLTKTAEKITYEDAWQDAVLTAKSGSQKPIDFTAYYTKADPTGVSYIITIYDKTAEKELENMKLDFVALAAHELRTPITIIKGNTESLSEDLGDSITEVQKHYLDKVNYAAAQLTGYINNILSVSRIEKGQLNLKFEQADWRAIVIEACKDLTDKAQQNNRALKLAIPEKLPTVSVDTVTIVEVINNLINNSIKYSFENTEIIVKVSLDENGYILTTVEDKGVGIPEALIGKLFKKFYRSHKTSTTHRGTGLGLYISKSIVEAHQGSIWVKSEEGVGSTFGFTLPTTEQFVNPDENDDNKTKIKGVHGWIKNHSLYRG